MINLPARIFRRALKDARRKFRNDSPLINEYLAAEAIPRLHISCGLNELQGWLNTEYHPTRSTVMHLDATLRFPFPNASFDLIYSEHVIEHLPLAGGVNMLSECWRILKPGGRVRISTPPLDGLIDLYHAPVQKHDDYHFEVWAPHAPVKTPAVILNDYARNWDHLFLYDEETLRAAFEVAGFNKIERCGLQESTHPLLRGLAHDGRMPPGLLDLTTMTFEAGKE